MAIPYHEHHISRITLGTAHFGNAYGVFPRQIFEHEAKTLLESCISKGINTIDTAHSYGKSQTLLGKTIKKNHWENQFQIVTKIAKDTVEKGERAIVHTVKESLDILGVSSVFALLIHGYDNFQHWDSCLCPAIKRLKEEGLIRYAGASVYHPSQFLKLMELENMEVFQIPSNPLDFRWSDSGVYQKAQEAGKICFLRSLSLQGLLLSGPHTVPLHLGKFEPVLEIWRNWCSRKQVSPMQAILDYGYLLNCPLVLGMDTPEQVSQNVKQLRVSHLMMEDFLELRASLPATMDMSILNPVEWPKG